MAKMSVDLQATDKKMTLMLKNPQSVAAQIIFPTKEASRLSGNLLTAARVAYEVVHKQPPKLAKGEKVSMTVVSPSGHNIGQGKKPSSTLMTFYFGETVLGIELPNDDARIIARRILKQTA